MNYRFTAIRKNGERYDGQMEASDKLALARNLRTNGDILVSVKEKKTGDINLDFLQKIKTTDLILFCRNMAGLMQAGVSLARAIEILEKQTTNKKMKDVLHSIFETIKSGGSLSDALSKHPKVFDSLFISMMRAGEESGNLVGTLKEVELHIKRSYDLKRKIKGAMTYPIVILGAMGIIGILMMKYVVPNLLKVFTDFKMDLPFTTKIVLWLANTIDNYFIFLVIGISIIIFLIFKLTKLPKVKKFLSIIVIKLPSIGIIAKQTLTARTARTLASLLKSGVSVTRSLEITRDVIGNFQYKAVMEKALQDIQKGTPMSKSFQAHPNLYPIMMGDMIEVGEESGKVGDMLQDVALFYEEEVDQKTKNLSTIVEPILMLIIGGAVGFFAVAMMTPMYSMMESVK
jgi:type IV pilus assembly protein PilC